MDFRRLKKKIRSAAALLHEKQLVPIPTPVNTNELLEGKVALITGGSGGIGIAIAEAFLRSGCKVILAGTNEEKVHLVCEKLLKAGYAGGYIHGVVLNVLDVESLPDKIRMSASLFPEGRIDILVNCAGVISSTPPLKMKEQEYDKVLDTNAKGTYFMCQAMGNYMIEKAIRGHILNLSSSSALRPAATPYQVSKWAVRGITLGFADALLPYGIIVNAIAPGPVSTTMMGCQEGDTLYKAGQPSGRYAVPSEIASLAVFMVSSMGDLIVGDTFYITGGSGVISLHR